MLLHFFLSFINSLDLKYEPSPPKIFNCNKYKYIFLTFGKIKFSPCLIKHGLFICVGFSPPINNGIAADNRLDLGEFDEIDDFRILLSEYFLTLKFCFDGRFLVMLPFLWKRATADDFDLNQGEFVAFLNLTSMR